jgi:hypothetical protein
MASKKVQTYSLSEMKDKYVGKPGTKERDKYECGLRMDERRKIIKPLSDKNEKRRQLNLTMTFEG